MYKGDYFEDATVRALEWTRVNGVPTAPSAALAAADLKIYKDGSATAKATTNGITVTSPFSGVTGLHQISIDTSNDTGDAGFWTSGASYTAQWVTVKTLGGRVIGGELVSWSAQNRHMRGTDSAALASVVGALSTAAKTGDPNSSTTLMGYIKQLVNLLAGSAGIATMPGEAPPANGVNIFKLLSAIHADVTGLNGEAMRGTNNGALASNMGFKTDAVATGDPGTTASLYGYLKQLVNILIGSAGVASFPAESAPGDGVSLAEVLRAVHEDVTGLNGSAMRGTDSAALASAVTAAFTEIKGATFDAGTDTLEAIRDRGDAAWTTGAGGSAPTVEEIRTEMDDNSTKLASIDAGVAALPAATDIVTGGAITTSAGAVSNVTLVGTTTTNTDMRGTDGAATAGALTSVQSDVTTLVDAVTDVTISGTAIAGTLSVTQASTDLTGLGTDQLIGRIIVWTSGAARREATDITGNTSSGVLTFTGLTTAPAPGDTFRIS